MNGIRNEERQRLGALLDKASQVEVMGMIPQFSQADVHNLAPMPQDKPDILNVLVFNMERGVHLDALGDCLETCPGIQPFDVILGNEMDDGCVRSGNRDTAAELAKRLGMNYVYGLEFIELVNGEDVKGHHGNAIFSRWPIRQAKILRLPEEFNWYFDSQKRIGSRLAILAELDVAGRSVGVVTIHLENRTTEGGRGCQMAAILQAAEEMFPDMPIILGGDLNTMCCNGRNTGELYDIVDTEAFLQRCFVEVTEREPCLKNALEAGYKAVPEIRGEQSGELVQKLGTCRDMIRKEKKVVFRLDWLLLRGAEAEEVRVISTLKSDCGFALPGSALERFEGVELSDHNAVWAACRIANGSRLEELF